MGGVPIFIHIPINPFQNLRVGSGFQSLLKLSNSTMCFYSTVGFPEPSQRQPTQTTKLRKLGVLVLQKPSYCAAIDVVLRDSQNMF